MAVQSNILEKNQKILNKRFLEKTRYIDCDYRGYINEETNPTLNKGDAIINSVKLWLLSRGGDYYKNLNKGGVLDKLLNTPLTENHAQDVQSYLEENFNVNFKLVELQNLQVQPIAEKRAWKISFQILDILNKEIISFGINISV